MKILLLGGAGYIGRVVAHRLASAGHEINIVDLFNFSAPEEMESFFGTKVCDTRNLTVEDFARVDAVVDMAAISNDPSGELDPELTYEINARARIRAAHLAREAGVARHLLFSSCSVYGANDDLVDETSPVHPLTAYARSNVLAEEGILALNGENFCTVAFRLATVFGLSPSMRFDLVVNTMTLAGFENGRLLVNGGGDQHRPLVHIGDVARATEMALKSDSAAVGGQIFNISHVNLRMRDVAAAVVTGVARPVEVQVDASDIDQRNYRVDNTKAREKLGFVAEHTVEAGAAGIMAALENGRLQRLPNSIRLHGYRTMVGRRVS